MEYSVALDTVKQIVFVGKKQKKDGAFPSTTWERFEYIK